MLGTLSQVKITENSVEIDGHDISHDTSAICYTHRAGEVPVLEVQLRTAASPIISEAMVQYVRPAEVADWLSRIDPDDLEHEVLKRMGGLGGGPSQGELYLEVLKEWSSGT